MLMTNVENLKRIYIYVCRQFSYKCTYNSSTHIVLLLLLELRTSGKRIFLPTCITRRRGNITLLLPVYNVLYRYIICKWLVRETLKMSYELAWKRFPKEETYPTVIYNTNIIPHARIM